MKFTHFSHICAKPRMTPHERYEQLWRELQVCDELGFEREKQAWPILMAVSSGTS
jgi:hypothetical protein